MGDPPTGNFVALEEAFEEPKEQRRVLRLAEQGKLKVRLQEKLAASLIPEAAEAAWEEVEREFGFEPNPNAKTAFASTLPVPDDHPLTWLLVPPERCGELAATGTTTVRNLPFAEDPEQLAVFSEPKTIRLQDLWIERTEAEKLLPVREQTATPIKSLQAYHQLIVNLLVEDWKQHEGWPRYLNQRIWKQLKDLKDENPDHHLISRIDANTVRFVDDGLGWVSIAWGDSWLQCLKNLKPFAKKKLSLN
jgi:hypothetical protein